MSPFFVSCLWCVFQISLLCAAGIALSLVVRRYPASSAAVMSVTAGVVLVATMLIPVQIPHWVLPGHQIVEMSVASISSTDAESGRADTNTDSSNTAMVDLGALLSKVRIAIHADIETNSLPSFAIQCLTAFAAFGISVGLLRLGGAFFTVWRIRRGSVPIDGSEADAQMKDLVQTMGCRTPARLATSADIRSAAVIGWLRPLVVLSTDWKTWPREQLQVVLAHELAHVVRRDYLWRAIGTIARAAHYYHPLAHWLLNRLAYSQEVAADQLAARTLGNREKYLKALSQLAMRQDDLLRLHREPILLPTSSSHLIRRIKMLRTKERTQSRGMNFAVRAMAVGTVVLLAVATTALRGPAEPADREPTTPNAQTEDALKSTDGMFQYPPIDPAMIGENEDGVFVLRVGEILKRDSIKPMIRRLNHAVSAACKSWLGSPELVEFDLEMIDYVVGQAEFKIKRLERNLGSKHNSQLMFGSSYWVVRFNRDISSWQQWIRKNAPAAEELQQGEITYFQFPAIPAIGPQGIRVAARDSHTLVFSTEDSENFWKQVEATNTVSARWTESWNAVDRGLFSLLATDKSIETSVEKSSIPTSDALNQVFDNIEQIGFGTDWNDHTNQMAFKIHLYCASLEEAEIVQGGVEAVTSLKVTEMQAEIDELENDSQTGPTVVHVRSLNSLKNLESQITMTSNGTFVVQVELFDPFPLDELIRQLLPAEVASRESTRSTTK